MIGVTRGISTLVGAAIAGVLLWFSSQVGAETAGEYWATYGIVAAAGLTMALSQIAGGWTKWGWPRFSVGVFVLGLLPALIVGGWVLLARQPADFFNTANWSRDLGIFGVVEDLGAVLPAIAFGIGLIFGLSFDTAGREPEVVHTRRDHDGLVLDRDADEPPVEAEHRGPYAPPPTVPVTDMHTAGDEEQRSAAPSSEDRREP